MQSYLQHISAGGAVQNIQLAINKIANELLTDPTITQDIIITVDRGTYPSFNIPDGALYALSGSPYRLIIRAAGSFFPIIDRNLSSNEVGIDIGAANPNIKIERLRVQHFAVGIRFSANSHFPIVKDCLITNNRNIGIWFERCQESQSIQNIVVNGDYGIVVRSCKNAAIIHNTIFLDGSLSNEEGIARSCIWAALAKDYGNGLVDSGNLHLIGNIAWNMAGPCLSLFYDDFELGAIVSNFNDWVLGQDYIQLLDRSFYVSNPRPRREYQDLRSWKATGLDQNSISSDPKFVRSVRVRGTSSTRSLDLSVLSISPVLGMVPSFYADSQATAEWLPTYVDSSLLSRDILQNTRLRDGTAAGSNEKASSSGFFGQDIFISPLDLGTSKDCDINPLDELISNSLDLWMPELNAGYFYANEREYYLYAQKRAQFLGQIAKTWIQLPGIPVLNKPIMVSVGDEPVVDYDIRGSVLVLSHKDLPIINGEEEVLVDCWIRRWGIDGFVYEEAQYRQKIKNGTTRFFLNEDYVSTAPVVITDDVADFIDPDELSNREFSIEFDPIENQCEVIFSQRSNLIINPQFDYVQELTGDMHPLSWDSTGVKILAGDQPNYPVIGWGYGSIDPAGYLSQIVPIDTKAHTLSWHMHQLSGSGVGSWAIKYYDNNLDYLGLTISGQHNLTSDWVRYYTVLGTTGDDFSGVVPQILYPLDNLGYQSTPENSRFIEFTISYQGSGSAAIDALQYEASIRPTPYHRIPQYQELTIEYETSTGNFVDLRQAISPCRSQISQGFLYIPELPASLYDGPDDDWVTTLFEYRWPQGRINYLPWARLFGKDKLRKRVAFHEVPQPKKEIIQPVHSVVYPAEINIIPDPVVCRCGDTNGQGIAIGCLGQDGNPYSLSVFYAQLIDSRGKFPGWISKRKYGLKEQLGQTLYGRLDNAGTTYLTWIPPMDVIVSRDVPRLVTPQGMISERMSSIDLPYTISSANHGNLSIRDDNGINLPTSATESFKATYIPIYNQDHAVITLEFPPVVGSIKVWINNQELEETIVNILDSNQFFVDYEDATITVLGKPNSIVVSYIPSYVIIRDSNPYQAVLYHDRIFNGYTGRITVGYDILINLKILVQLPKYGQYLDKVFPLIGQNPIQPTKNLAIAAEF